ncbi:MAG: ADP-ribosylglycohydrolase family protein [Cyanobacteria bacterium P01_A01_bin.105]
MQTPTVFQFQAAFLALLRALPAAYPTLRQGLTQVLAPFSALPSPGEAQWSNEITLSTAPIDQLIYRIPALLLDTGMTSTGMTGTGMTGTAPYIPPTDVALQEDLDQLRGVVALLLDRSSFSHGAGPTPWSAALPPQSPVYPSPADPPPADQKTPLTAALTALRTVTENADLTVTLAQNLAQDSGCDGAMAGAIAGFLVGLSNGTPYSPKTEDERALLPLSQQLFNVWAGLTHTPQSPLSITPYTP